jgi:ribosomal-protein-alanine N-acetyltransferase
MSAVLRDERLLLPMTVKQLDGVLAIEQAAYPFPWTRGNFIDSLASEYPSQVLHGAQGELLGYFVAMEGVDELHLLNITVSPSAQHQGHARFMLDELCALGRERRAHQLWLEVRESNERARAIYVRYGFQHIGLRRGYYPALRSTHASGREDAIVMSLQLEEALPHALG